MSFLGQSRFIFSPNMINGRIYEVLARGRLINSFMAGNHCRWRSADLLAENRTTCDELELEINGYVHTRRQHARSRKNAWLPFGPQKTIFQSTEQSQARTLCV